MDFLLLGSITVFLLSLLLTFVSMGNFQEKPNKKLNFSPFLLRNPNALDPTLLQKIHLYLLSKDTHFSIEKLYKGKEIALVIFAPQEFPGHFPDLNLLEIKEYIQNLKKSSGAELITKGDGNKNFFFPKQLTLQSDDYCVLQLVLKPVPKRALFNLTSRIVVISSEATQRVEILKKVFQQLAENSVLSPLKNQAPIQIINSFKQRTLRPVEISKQFLTYEQILNMLSLNG